MNESINDTTKKIDKYKVLEEVESGEYVVRDNLTLDEAIQFMNWNTELGADMRIEKES